MSSTVLSGTALSSVTYDVTDRVATIAIDRPDRRNAFSWSLMEELDRCVSAALADAGVRVLVLTGSESDFSVGADLAADPETRILRGRSVDDDEERLRWASRIPERLVTATKPVIAAIEGGCAGAGLSLALAAHLRVAADTAVFNTAFVQAGMSGDMGSAWLLSRIVGPSTARRLLLRPGKITAAEALGVGLVDEVSTDAHARTGEVAGALAAAAPLAVAGVLANVLATDQSFSEYLAGEVPRMVTCAQSDDAKEAGRAFLEKRVPRFAGS